MKKCLLTIFLFVAATLMWAAKPPTDEQLKSFCRDAGAALMGCETADAKKEAFNKVTEQFAGVADITKITPQQVVLLFDNGGLTLDHLLRIWLEPTFVQRAKSETIFAYYQWKYMPENDGFMHGEKETSAFVNFLSAKDLQKTVTEYDEIATEVFDAMSTMKDANWHSAGFADGMLRLMKCDISDKAVMECVKVFNSIARVDTIDTSLREQFRTMCRDKYAKLASTLDSQRKIKNCNDQIKYLDGPFACGTLVGGKAPELHFIRMLQQGKDSVELVSAANLDAFKGKVVMLDFWGTKCVPCLQSFPELAEMQSHFEDKDVVIIGVTSLQGYFVDANKRTIQCRNDKEKEMSYFPEYMKAKGITWTIGISEEDVMNSDYGALAIPHVVIIDKQGIVRHNAVNGDKETKIKLIEQYL